MKITTTDELYVKLEGKTERSEIEAILNGATVATLRTCAKYEGLYGEPLSTWRKAKLVQEVADCLIEQIEVEEIRTDVLREKESQPEALYDDETYSDFEKMPVSRKNFSEGEVSAMLKAYAEIRGTIQAIRDGVRIFRRDIEILTKQGLPSNGLSSGIYAVKAEYRKLRREGYELWRLLHKVMSSAEILRACKEVVK